MYNIFNSAGDWNIWIEIRLVTTHDNVQKCSYIRRTIIYQIYMYIVKEWRVRSTTYNNYRKCIYIMSSYE